ncbi:MerR family transcriptional regulator [Clostridium botulinum]|uniref:ATP-binding protein n=1 Tax=Clostridium botulinum TaxID=1491 RepID=UPI0009B1FCD5|nr:ATP-binding protein [Clostridium botulinum]NFF20632.1 MerR family transcriptional regulator [Clostridium botulinum]NFM74761.1 MerR family transcriptional regulator [Clostridium botulinum]NFP79382.1 MerR family transcriptional regulator [Clostridium botulinum]NFP93559.1 MerR family transcriptional regulator [Clostridium botulinum]NFS35000.1 MerR family transcriptional regulator [Clostridium botulinum]
MTEIERIIQKMKLNMTSPNTKVDYKCNKCQDTTFVQGENGLKRCECYKKDLTKRRWAHFGIDPSKVKRISEYAVYSDITKRAKQVAIDYIRDYTTIKTKEENNLAFLGQPGAGKSHLAIGIGANLINSGVCTNIVYMPYQEAMRELKANSMDDEYYIKIQAKYLKAELLIIDDLFKDKIKNGKLVGELTESDIKHIQPIINQRYLNCKPTIYNSELTPELLINLDQALAGRILEKSNIVIFKYNLENNYRMRKFV